MRENRLYGSEGGAAESNRPLLPLSTAQGRRVSRRTLGHGRQHARIPRRGFTRGRNHNDSAIPPCETPSAYRMDGNR